MRREILSADGLEVYYGRSQVLFGMSLKVRQGDTLALLGRNGAGKSTTMKALVGLLPLRAGRVQLNGVAIEGRATFRIARAGVGYVPEDRQIFPDHTVEDNLTIGAKAGENGLDYWNLERVYEMLPLLGPLKNRLGGQLSGGEQQLLTIGRTLMGNPSVVLLDEPSEGLAPIMVRRVGELIRQLREVGTTIVLAEQNLHFCLGLADGAVVIDRGRAVYEGTIAELRANAEVKQRYLSV
ncbi:MAG: ABC transporter ATP-binding protein [Burkholderiaceae bacterium]|nr:ABC transporter ATP-binding protein [Burkholderiaceae bacterium]